MKKLLSIFLALAMMFGTIRNTSFAEEAGESLGQEVLAYKIDTSSLGSLFQDYLSQVYLSKTEEGWELIVNNTSVGFIEHNEVPADGVLTFDYYPDTFRVYHFKFNLLTGEADLDGTVYAESYVQSIFVFKLESGIQKVYFYADKDATPIVREATHPNSQMQTDYGTFSFEHKGKTITFSLAVDEHSEEALITKNGVTTKYPLTLKQVSQKLFCEYLVPASTLKIEYLEKGLPKLSFSEAQNHCYTEQEINAALKNEKITLTNNATGREITVSLQQNLNIWHRNEGSSTAIGDGTYEATGTSAAVVFQWNDAGNASMRNKLGENGRLYAVFGNGENYTNVVSQTKSQQRTYYKVYQWPENLWKSSGSAFPSDKASIDTTAVQYRTREFTISLYSAWTYVTPDEYGEYYDYQTRKVKAQIMPGNDLGEAGVTFLYRYRTKSFETWSDWQYTRKAATTDINNTEIEYRYNEGTFTLKTGDVETVLPTTVGRIPGKSKSDTGTKMEGTETIAETQEQAYASSTEMTQKEILDFADYIQAEAAGASYIEKTKKNTGENVTWNDYTAFLTSAAFATYYKSSEALKAREDFLEVERFIPYFYITEHYRCQEQSFDLAGYFDTISLMTAVVFPQEIHEEGVAMTAYYEEPQELKDTFFIYFDYRDPLKRFTETPKNWVGYEALVEEIKNSDFQSPVIQVKLSHNDLVAMNEWINQNYTKLGTGAMLREFSYIFTEMNDELREWFESGGDNE